MCIGSEAKLKPMYVSTTRLKMVGLKECSMEDEDCSQTILFNFQEVRIQQYNDREKGLPLEVLVEGSLRHTLYDASTTQCYPFPLHIHKM